VTDRPLGQIDPPSGHFYPVEVKRGAIVDDMFDLQPAEGGRLFGG
jgi:hypothetical protein